MQRRNFLMGIAALGAGTQVLEAKTLGTPLKVDAPPDLPPGIADLVPTTPPLFGRTEMVVMDPVENLREWFTAECRYDLGCTWSLELVAEAVYRDKVAAGDRLTDQDLRKMLAADPAMKVLRRRTPQVRFDPYDASTASARDQGEIPNTEKLSFPEFLAATVKGMAGDLLDACPVGQVTRPWVHVEAAWPSLTVSLASHVLPRDPAKAA